MPNKNVLSKTQLLAAGGVSSFDPNQALISDENGKITTSETTSEEISYVHGVTSSIQDQLNAKQNTINDLSQIRSGAAAGATAVQPSDLATVATSGSYNDLINLPDYGYSLELDLNTSTYVLTLTLKDQNGNVLSTQDVDFPVESVVVNGTYDNTNKRIILTLQNGNTINIPVGDLVAGLQTEITPSNKLNADLVDDSTSTHKFASASQLTQISTNASNILSLQTNKQDALTSANAGTGIAITEEAGIVKISNTQTSAEWGNITGNLGNQTDLQDALDEKQDTLVSGTNIKTINSTSVLGSGNFTLANQSLSNLNADGQMIIDSQNGTISNCILEIPQNIKLTLENNTLTLKAGSIVSLARENYVTYTVANDLVRPNLSLSENKKYMFFTNNDGTSFSWNEIDVVGSGNSLPNDNSDYLLFFLTSDKNIYAWSGGSWSKSYKSYPICILESNNGVVSFAKDSNDNDMIFNGAGFIGHHVFVYPNVKGLTANGIDENGEFKSSSFKRQSLVLFESSSANNTRCLLIANTGQCWTNGSGYVVVDELPDDAPEYQVYYNKKENLYYRKEADGFHQQNSTVFIENINTISNSGTLLITDFTIRQPVRLATTEMLNEIQANIEVDGVTIQKNSSNQFQAIGSLNKNTTSGATPNVYDWVGTYAEYQAQDIENTHPEWLCFITDDEEFSIFKTNQLTNCITEIPQDIKLELNNDTLIVKAGSKVYYPNGTNTFDTIILNEDKTVSCSGSGTFFVIAVLSSMTFYCNRVDSITVTSDNEVLTHYTGYVYNTTDNEVYFWNNGVKQTKHTFPVGLVKIASGVPTSIDQAFNGFGYIGSSIFALPGVKGLIPNGFNDDGSLKNTHWTCNNVVVRTFPENESYINEILGFDGFAFSRLPRNVYSYNQSKNYNNNDGYIWNDTVIGSYKATTGIVSNFNIKTAFHALGWNDNSAISGWSMPSTNRYIVLTLGASGSTYTAPANGWFCLRKNTESANQYVEMECTSNQICSKCFSPVSSNEVCVSIPVLKNQEVWIAYNASGSSNLFCFIYAEGEQ